MAADLKALDRWVESLRMATTPVDVWFRMHDDKLRQVGEIVRNYAALVAALRSLINEASGFLAMADRDTHGNTNIAVLQHHIDNARAALEQAEGRALSTSTVAGGETYEP